MMTTKTRRHEGTLGSPRNAATYILKNKIQKRRCFKWLEKTSCSSCLSEAVRSKGRLRELRGNLQICIPECCKYLTYGAAHEQGELYLAGHAREDHRHLLQVIGEGCWPPL